MLTLYELMASFSPKMNSSSNSTSKELLIKYVFYYLFVPFTGQKKGVITYKSINGMSSFQKHLKLIINNFKLSGMNKKMLSQKELDSKKKGGLQIRGLAQSPTLLMLSLVVVFLTKKWSS
jgi:hypothetical protein